MPVYRCLVVFGTPFFRKKTNTSDVRDNLLIKASAKQLQMETLFLQWESLSCQKLMSWEESLLQFLKLHFSLISPKDFISFVSSFVQV